MKDWFVLGTFALVVTAALLIVGCSGGGGGSTTDTYAMTEPDLGPEAEAQLMDSAEPDGTVSASAVPTLTLTLNSTLTSGGTAKITKITSADLLDARNAVVKTATIASGKARFDYAGLAAGFYSIRVNNLPNDLVPTKLDSLTLNTWQWVSPTLRHTVIGSLTNPKYRIMTYALGQAGHPVVDYSDGSNSSPTRYAYDMLYLRSNPVRLDIRRLGKNTRLTMLAAGGHHNMATWALAHGGSTSSCTSCHGTLTNKQAVFTDIRTSKGWCYRCHYGPDGAGQGMVDPRR
jgi:hypothetical protein